jgi:hypothetical protein
MKGKFLLLFTLITSINFSQVQKIFYVDDVKTIDYVTVKFCVNDSARIDKVTVLPEKTTYKNESTIEQLIEYLKTVQYYSDSKLRNNCYPSTFEFVNKKYENAKLTESEFSKCEKFKKGKFKYIDVRYLDTKIKRTKKKQVEISNDFKAKYKISWTSPCEYEMTYTKVREKENKYLLGKTIKVKIIGLLQDSYIYLADFMEKPTVIGEMKKIK